MNDKIRFTLAAVATYTVVLGGAFGLHWTILAARSDKGDPYVMLSKEDMGHLSARRRLWVREALKLNILHSIRIYFTHTLIPLLTYDFAKIGVGTYRAFTQEKSMSDEAIRAGDLVNMAESNPGAAKEHVHDIVDLFASDDVVARNNAIAALAITSEEYPEVAYSHLEAIRPLLSDEDDDTRVNALNAVYEAAANDPREISEMAESVRPLLSDENKEVSESALFTMVFIGMDTPEAVTDCLEEVIPMLDSKDEYVRWGAATIVGQVALVDPDRARTAKDDIRPLLNDEDRDVREVAQEVIELMEEDVEVEEETFAGEAEISENLRDNMEVETTADFEFDEIEEIDEEV